MKILEFIQESVSMSQTNLTSYFSNPYKMDTSLSTMIKPFSSEEDVVVWLRNVNLVIKLQKLNYVAAVIPLFLEGEALALYLELSEQDQENVDIIRDWNKHFAKGLYETYEKLVSVLWIRESVDVYANKIKQLVELVGYRGYGAEIAARIALITGFPAEIAQKLQQITAVEKMEMRKLIR